MERISPRSERSVTHKGEKGKFDFIEVPSRIFLPKITLGGHYENFEEN